MTLDRDGMALVRADGRAEIVPTRPRQVYDITGAGDMVLAVVGLCLAAGADYDEAAALATSPAAWRSRRSASRSSRARDPPRPARPPSARGGQAARSRGACSPRSVAAAWPGRRSSSPTAASTCCTPATSGSSARPPAQGDFLVVGLNSDASVRRLKGPTRPVNPEDARGELLAALECVDAVTVFDEDTPLALIEAIRPDVLVKGGDYRPDEVVGRDVVEAAGGRLVLIPLVQGHSTTQLALSLRDGDRTVAVHPAEPSPPAPASRSAAARSASRG